MDLFYHTMNFRKYYANRSIHILHNLNYFILYDFQMLQLSFIHSFYSFLIN